MSLTGEHEEKRLSPAAMQGIAARMGGDANGNAIESEDDDVETGTTATATGLASTGARKVPRVATSSAPKRAVPLTASGVSGSGSGVSGSGVSGSGVSGSGSGGSRSGSKSGTASGTQSGTSGKVTARSAQATSTATVATATGTKQTRTSKLQASGTTGSGSSASSGGSNGSGSGSGSGSETGSETGSGSRLRATAATEATESGTGTRVTATGGGSRLRATAATEATESGTSTRVTATGSGGSGGGGPKIRESDDNDVDDNDEEGVEEGDDNEDEDLDEDLEEDFGDEDDEGELEDEETGGDDGELTRDESSEDDQEDDGSGQNGGPPTFTGAHQQHQQRSGAIRTRQATATTGTGKKGSKQTGTAASSSRFTGSGTHHTAASLTGGSGTKMPLPLRRPSKTTKVSSHTTGNDSGDQVWAETGDGQDVSTKSAGHQGHQGPNNRGPNPKTFTLAPTGGDTGFVNGGGGGGGGGGCQCGGGCPLNVGCRAVGFVYTPGYRYNRRNDSCCGCDDNGGGRGGDNGCCGGGRGHGGGGGGDNGCCGGGRGHGGGGGGDNGCCGGGRGHGGDNGCCGNDRGHGGGGRRGGGGCWRVTLDVVFGFFLLVGVMMVLVPYRMHQKFVASYVTTAFGETNSAHFTAGPWAVLLIGWVLIVLSLWGLDWLNWVFRWVDCCCGSRRRNRDRCEPCARNCGTCDSCLEHARFNGGGGGEFGGKSFGLAHGHAGGRGTDVNLFHQRFFPIIMDGVQWLYAVNVIMLACVLDGLVHYARIEYHVPSIYYLDKLLIGTVLYYIIYRLFIIARTRINFQVVIVLTALLVEALLHVRYWLLLNYYQNTYQFVFFIVHFIFLWLSSLVLCWIFNVWRLEQTSIARVNLAVC